VRRSLVAAALALAGLGAAVGRPLVVVLATVPLSVLAAEALRAGEPLGRFFAARDDVVKFGVGERLQGTGVAEGLREQTATTEGWRVEGRRLVVGLATVPLWVLGAGALGAPAAPRVSADRELSNAAPAVGERVTVRVTVENEGWTVADCLVADAVPEGVDAVDAPQVSVRLPAGATATLAYDVVARRGSHEFGPVSVTARGLLGGASVERDVETSFRCRADSRPLELRASVSRRVGERTVDAGGSGVEFHSVREYRPSDPQRRIDWRRFARSRELTTVQFREESAATVHLVVDARAVCDVRGRAVDPPALEYCADAVERLAGAFVSRGVDVGVGLYPDAVDALPPAGGHPQRTRIRRLLDGHEAFPWGSGESVPEVRRGSADGRTAAPDEREGGPAATRPSPDGGVLPEPLRRDARVLLVTPCLDDVPVEFATAVYGAGGDVGVLAVDVGGETPGAVVERALREERLSRLAGAGVPLTDWDVEAPLSVAVEEVFATWT
jgi:uncharacterized protein (DUF58 family)